MKAQRGSRGIYLTSLLDECGWSTPCPGGFTILERDSVPIKQEVGWAPGSVWMFSGNLTLPGFYSRTVQFVASRYLVPYEPHCIFKSRISRVPHFAQTRTNFCETRCSLTSSMWGDGPGTEDLVSWQPCSFVTLTATSRRSSALLFATYTNRIMDVARVRREKIALIKNLHIFCGKYIKGIRSLDELLTLPSFYTLII